MSFLAACQGHSEININENPSGGPGDGDFLKYGASEELVPV